MRNQILNPDRFLVLIVDDVARNLQILEAILRPEGYALTFANSGKQALERAKQAKPDLILLDLMMPDIDGLDVCEALQSDSHCCNIPIIFLTASPNQDHVVKAFNVGAVDYVTKPFQSQELLARIKTHLLLRQTLQELQAALAQVEALSRTDSLTGMLNRYRFMEIVQQEFDRAVRSGTPFSLLLLDLDHFKRVNDTYGHLVGDLVLKEISHQLQAEVRSVDAVGRFGGEEFVVVLPSMELADAEAIAQHICQHIASLVITIPTGTLQVTVSIGIAGYTPEDQTVEQVINRADQGLYAAKAQGRNTYCFGQNIMRIS
jgi:diguanylate cyclase (GGDEF)-like protein